MVRNWIRNTVEIKSKVKNRRIRRSMNSTVKKMIRIRTSSVLTQY